MNGPDDKSRETVAILRKAWLDSGITLAELRRRIGVKAPQAVSQMLDGKRGIQLSSAHRIANALGYDLALIPREDAP